MVVETTKNQIVLNKIVGQKRENRQVETDVIVNDVKPDVLKVINTNGVISIYKKDVMDGKIRIDGAINTYIIYMADDEQGSIRSLNTSMDFTQVINMDNCKENMQADVRVSIKDFDTKIINGRKLSIKANLDTNVNIYANENCDVITEVGKGEPIEKLGDTQTITSLVGSGNNKVSLKDTIAIDMADEMAEIMKVDFDIVDEETKISYNKVLSKADASIRIMYLTEDNRINTATTKIPIMGFVDMQNVNENCECEVQNNLNNLIVKPNSNEEHSIAIEADIDITCLAYETKQINMIEDLYSITKDITFTKREVNAVIERNRITDMYTAKENIRIPEVTGRVLDVQIAPTINNMQVRNGKVIYEGNLNLNIMFEQSNGINTRGVDLPYNFDVISDKIEEKSMVETTLKIKQNDFIIRDGTIEVTIGVEFNLSEQKSRKINMIENVEMEESKECNTYSMVIYFVKQGDTLWSIAKRFKSTVEDIAKINDIENPNKISVGQRLYIPRYCNRRVAV